MKFDTAHQFLEDLKGDVKTFQNTRGNGPGKPAGSLKDIQRNAEAAEHHAAMSAEHEGMSEDNKAQGNRAIASLHSDASDHHDSLSDIHTNLAAAHAQKAKSAVKPMGEAFVTRGYQDANDLVDFSKYDMQKSPASRGELDEPRAKHSLATVKDLENVCQHVASRHSARVELIRSLGDNGFVAALVIPPGLYLGTTTPSVSSIESEMVQELRNVAPAAVVDLITNDEVPMGSGPNARRLVFRFRLRDRERGGF